MGYGSGYIPGVLSDWKGLIVSWRFTVHFNISEKKWNPLDKITEFKGKNKNKPKIAFSLPIGLFHLISPLPPFGRFLFVLNSSWGGIWMEISSCIIWNSSWTLRQIFIFNFIPYDAKHKNGLKTIKLYPQMKNDWIWNALKRNSRFFYTLVRYSQIKNCLDLEWLEMTNLVDIPKSSTGCGGGVFQME